MPLRGPQGRVIQGRIIQRMVAVVPLTVAGVLPGSGAAYFPLHASPAVARAPSGTHPPGSQVLTAMMLAWNDAGSDTFTIAERSITRSRSAKTIITDCDTGAVAWQNPPLFRMTSTEKEIKVTVGRSFYVFGRTGIEVQRDAQDLLAIKLNIARWSCDPFFGYSALPGSPLGDETSPWGIPSKNLGQVTINGAPAWRIRTELTLAGPKGHKWAKTRVTTDYFVAQTTWLPLKIQRSCKLRCCTYETSRQDFIFFSRHNPTAILNPSRREGREIRDQ